MSSSDHRGVPQGNAAIIAAIIGAVIGAVATIFAAFIGVRTERIEIIFPTQVAINRTPTDAVNATQAPKGETGTAQPNVGIPVEEMPVIEGTYAYKTDTMIRGEKYPQALLFPQSRIVIRLLQKYQTLTMKVSVDDRAGLGGFKHIWIRDHNGNVLFEGDAKPVLEPLAIEVDVSHAEYVEIDDIDYNGQTAEYVRWIDIRFFPKK